MIFFSASTLVNFRAFEPLSSLGFQRLWGLFWATYPYQKRFIVPPLQNSQERTDQRSMAHVIMMSCYLKKFPLLISHISLNLKLDRNLQNICEKSVSGKERVTIEVSS